MGKATGETMSNHPQTPDAVSKIRNLGLLALVIGAVGLVFAFLGDVEQGWRAYFLGNVYWVGMSLGCLGLLMIQHLTGGDWGVVMRRVLESGAATVVLTGLLLAPAIFSTTALHSLFPWTHLDAVESDHGHGEDHAPETHEPREVARVAALDAAAPAAEPSTEHGAHGVAGYVAENRDFLVHKLPYLNVPFFQGRYVGYFVLWLLLIFVLWRWSSTQDEHPDPKLVKRMQALSAPGLILLALAASFASYDWLMSIYPTWYSTMYGVWFLGTFGIGALSLLILMGLFLGKREPMSKVLQPRHFHDWGKLLLAFVVLWAYFSISQFLIIWSGNLPDEIAWFQPRFEGGWLVVTTLLFLFHFGLPFVLLLSRDLKRNAGTLAGVAVFLLAMRWLDLHWQVAPSIQSIWGGEAVAWWATLAATLAVGGLWLVLFVWLLQRRPILPVGDPYLEEATAHEHH